MERNLAKRALQAGGVVKPMIIPSSETRGSGLCNPSVFIDDNGEILVIIRNVNYDFFHLEHNKRFANWATSWLIYLHREDDVRLHTFNFLAKLNEDLEKLHPEYKTINQDNWLMPFATFVKQENYKGTNHVQWDWDHLIRKKVIKTRQDLHPTPDLYLKWCEQEFDKPFQSKLIEKIRQKDWTTVDTSNNQLYEYLDWTDSKYRVKGK